MFPKSNQMWLLHENLPGTRAQYIHCDLCHYQVQNDKAAPTRVQDRLKPSKPTKYEHWGAIFSQTPLLPDKNIIVLQELTIVSLSLQSIAMSQCDLSGLTDNPLSRLAIPASEVCEKKAAVLFDAAHPLARWQWKEPVWRGENRFVLFRQNVTSTGGAPAAVLWAALLRVWTKPDSFFVILRILRENLDWK